MPQKTNKFDANKFNANKMRKLLEQETEYISNLFAIFDVPDSVEGNFMLACKIHKFLILSFGCR